MQIAISNLSGCDGYKGSLCNHTRKENTVLSLDSHKIFLLFRNPLPTPLSEDFNNRILFCALSRERGNDFSFLISELKKLISSHTYMHAHPHIELWKRFITLGTAPPPTFYITAKKNSLFGFLVIKKQKP